MTNKEKLLEQIKTADMNEIETVGAFKQVYELSHNNDLKYDFKFLDKVKEAYASRGIDFPVMFNDYYLREFRTKEEQKALAGWCSGESTEKPKNKQKKVSTGERVPYVNNNYIKLSRKMLDWQWYTDEHTKTLFIHCLLKANWKEGNFKGVTVNRGEFITSLQKLANETGLTIQSVKTALKHLELTEAIESKNIKCGRLIIVINYDSYQN